MFEKLKKNIDKSLVTVSVKSATYLESEKLKAKIGNIQADNAAQLQAMGNQLYNNWKATQQIDTAYIMEVCGRVLENEKEIAVYESQIEEIVAEKDKILNNSPAGGMEEQAQEGGILCACGHVNAAGAKFCRICGQKLVQPEVRRKRVCPNCNAVIEGDVKFCAECGSPLED